MKTFEIHRIKIESPYDPEFLFDSLYAEVHYPTNGETKYPYVYNTNSKKYVTTQREYNVNNFINFKNKSKEIDNSEFELVLIDTNPDYDKKWIDYFN